LGEKESPSSGGGIIKSPPRFLKYCSSKEVFNPGRTLLFLLLLEYSREKGSRTLLLRIIPSEVSNTFRENFSSGGI